MRRNFCFRNALGGTGLRPVVSGVAPETGGTATIAPAASVHPQRTFSAEIRRAAGFDGRAARATGLKTRLKFLALILLFAAGCASVPKNAAPRPANLFPTDAFQTQRAVLTAFGKQFTFNGYLALSKTGGKRLVIMENFGTVLADVLVKPDGKIYVMRANKIFTPKRIRRFVATDLETIFGDQPMAKWPVQTLGENHFLLQRRWYSLDLRIVETKLGAQSPDLFDETKALKP
jgi:hypothetical protein